VASDQQWGTLHSKFLEYPTGLEKQPIQLLVFQFSREFVMGEAGQVIVHLQPDPVAKPDCRNYRFC
jgi:hypothetical protein